MRFPNRTRPLVVTLACAGLALGLVSCSSSTVQQATDLGSAVASHVASGVGGITGGAVQRGMASLAGGIDGALDTALRGADVTTDGQVPTGFPTAAVPLVDGTVLGGGAGPNGSGWVVQVRADTVDDFATAQQQLSRAGFDDGTTRTDTRSAFGLFRSDDYRVVLTFSERKGAAVATYIVTPR